MSKTKHLVCTFYGVMPDMKSYLKTKLRGHRLTAVETTIDKQSCLNAETEILGVFVDSQVTAKIITALPKLKLIVTLSTGYDHIDLAAAKKRKIPVCNVPTYGENTVAQHALSLILALSRKLFPAVKRVKESVYDYHGLKGFDLKGRTIGIIGTGHIGIHLIEMLQGLSVTVLAFDVFPNKSLEKKGFKYVTLNEIYKKSDIISLHVPLLPSTHHLIDKKEIKKMKKGVYIINTARGGLINSEALVWGLETGQVAGAGLDVLESEDIIESPERLFTQTMNASRIKTNLMDNILIDHPATIVTPHSAFNSTEALQRIYDVTINNIKSFENGLTENDVTKPPKKS
ncbi:MAG TPA: NAD(P)-dependent oxidoreductase [Patescibacteria group bacterium]|nr:NAD(P)-dependent oxidoreductase [Patescibacteria group bacterium]